MINKIRRFNDWPIPIKIIMSFAIVIFLGSFLLSLPFSQSGSSQATYFDHLFNAVSMVAVTGLYTEPVAQTYTTIGQIIVLLLIKLGGLGLITLVSAVVLQFGKRVGLKEEVTLQQALNRRDRTDFRKFILSIVKYTSIIEVMGSILLAFQFVPLFGWRHGLFTSLFLSVSAFNNAGFDNLGTVSLQPFMTSPIVNTVIPLLIILGGLGFSVWFDAGKRVKALFLSKDWSNLRGNYRHLNLHSRLVIKWTFWLIVGAMLLFMLAEWNHLETIGALSLIDKLQVSFFQAVTLRTAGFGTVNYTELHVFTLMVFTIFMFIGGSPGGTAGGAKTSTVALVVILLTSEIKGISTINYKHHTLKSQIVKRALVIVVMFVLLNFVAISLMTLFDEHVPLHFLFFESVSAFGTVGLSADLTPTLSRYSQTILMFAMFIGRLGPITIFTALASRNKKHKDIRYATGDILIG